MTNVFAITPGTGTASCFVKVIWSALQTSAPIIEALATVFLGIYAVFQWKAIGKNNSLIGQQISAQQVRWSSEDQERKAREAIRYKFGAELREPKIVIWVANLGITSFFVDKVWLNMGPPLDLTKRFFHPKGFAWHVVLSAGEVKEFALPEGYSLGSPVTPDESGDASHECDVWLQIEHMDGAVKSDTITFTVRLGGEEVVKSFSRSGTSYVGR